MSPIELVNYAQNREWKICVYGLGTYGKSCSKLFLECLHIVPDYYCDQNIVVLDEFPIERRKKIRLFELLNIEEEILVFLFVSSRFENEINTQFKKNKNLHTINWEGIHELLNQDSILETYFGINRFVHNKHFEEESIIDREIFQLKNKPRIAVYTCITNSYDRLNKPAVFEENCDYFLITDALENQKIENDEFYNRIFVSDVVPSKIVSPKDQNRYCKTHGADIFKEYDYTIYLDGNIIIQKSISQLVMKTGKYGLALHKHPFCNDAYLEAFSLSARNRISKEDAIQTMKSFSKQGFERNYGMAECGIIICDNNNMIGKQILKRWYYNYENNPIQRDQIFFAYTLWEMNIKVSDVCTLPGNIRTNGYFLLVESHYGNKSSG